MELNNLLASPSYNDPNVYQPSTSALGAMDCSFVAPTNYDNNYNQFFIGRPSESILISQTDGVTIRLPDKYFGLFLAYAMDMYGLNPSMLMGLAAKESFFGALLAADDTGSDFLVADPTTTYNCHSDTRQGLCHDEKLAGPFQSEPADMATDVSIFAQRFWTGDSTTAIEDRTPDVLPDSDILAEAGFKTFHDNVIRDNFQATIVAALDLHFRYNVLIRLNQAGLLEQYLARNTRKEREQLVFAAAMYTYSSGITDKSTLNGLLSDCGVGKDPILDCGLDGFAGHSEDVGKVCTMLDRSPEVYDYPLSKSDIDWFINELQGTYPYISVSGLHGPINWTTLRSAASTAFDTLQANRGNLGVISFRYDFRPLLAVIRAFLPAKEILIGETIQTIDGIYGNSFNTDLGPIVSKGSNDPEYLNTAGSHAHGASDPLSVTFQDEYSPYNPSSASMQAYNLLAMFCAFALVILSFLF